ncbi:hypothetical protein AwMethylo_07140 [Methylobacterium sp.]|nr:hypothetical protein AwMethylo_07140 [Methylobacterium sp.]
MPAETPTAMAARNAWLEADNARLRRLLERHDAPAELRHRLRATLGLLREIIRRSAGFRPEAAVYAAHLEDRLLSLVRMHGAIDRSGEVDLHTAFADELVTYTLHEGQRLRLSGPDILLQTRTAQTLGLAIHELAVNAVEHGAGTGSEGRIDVSWRLEDGAPDPILRILWKETGLTGVAPPSHRGFGTQVLDEMMRHNLDAETELAYDPDGFRYTLAFSMPPHVGRKAEPR